ncbi:MAG: MBL fold metallo-hydrolase [Thermoplasmata archaeon]|nr:MBL fold metallo-hydrolase [Thermoplasmata archaeon]
MHIKFLGGADEVGSLGMVMDTGRERMLFDYGITPDTPPGLPLPSPHVDCVFLSHAHIDHSGMLPWISNRYECEIFATPPTIDVTTLLLEDSLRISEMEGYSLEYGLRDIRKTTSLMEPVTFGETVAVNDTEVTLHDAGHIPGATMFEIVTGKVSLFTGDLNMVRTNLVNGAKPVKCDYLFIESTYAGRNHPPREKTEYSFLSKIEDIVDAGGTALVPAFAVARTQEILLTLANTDYEIWLDGMGSKVNKIYLEHPGYLRNAKKLRNVMKNVNVVRHEGDRKRAMKGEVILTTSGMLDGGPVLEYLEVFRKKENCGILLTGYQVEGTNGRALLEKGSINIAGAEVEVKTPVYFFDFSAHAGHDDLLKFIEMCDPEKVVLMHGETREELAKAINGREVVLPTRGMEFEI